jgi:hypothetical protein
LPPLSHQDERPRVSALSSSSTIDRHLAFATKTEFLNPADDQVRLPIRLVHSATERDIIAASCFYRRRKHFVMTSGSGFHSPRVRSAIMNEEERSL